MNLQMKAMVAGLFFGVWPLLMNRSGLSGSVSSAAFAGICFLGVLPFALKNGIPNLTGANWGMILAAGLLGALGVLQFNGMLAKATDQNVGMLFVVMIVVQTSIPALYHVAMTGLTPRQALGFLAAFVAAILLTKT
jgi:hypothetical protein